MLNKINLIIKSITGNILITKIPQNNKWRFPYLFRNSEITKSMIASIFETTIDCGVVGIKAINYLFDGDYQSHAVSVSIPVIYYEVYIEKHNELAPNDFYSFFRYYSIEHLHILNNKSNDIEKYLKIIDSIKEKENKYEKDTRKIIQNSF